jgi:hypothetical protein
MNDLLPARSSPCTLDEVVETMWNVILGHRWAASSDPTGQSLFSVQSWVESKTHGHIDKGTTIYPRSRLSEVRLSGKRSGQPFEAVVELESTV